MGLQKVGLGYGLFGIWLRTKSATPRLTYGAGNVSSVLMVVRASEKSVSRKNVHCASWRVGLRQSASPLNLSCETAFLSMVLLENQFLEGSGDRSRCVRLHEKYFLAVEHNSSKEMSDIFVIVGQRDSHGAIP